MGELRDAPNGQCALACWQPSELAAHGVAHRRHAHFIVGELGACHNAEVALEGVENFNIELIALVQNLEFSIPENDDDTVELTRAPFEHELAGQRTRPFKDAELELEFCATKHLLR